MEEEVLQQITGKRVFRAFIDIQQLKTYQIKRLGKETTKGLHNNDGLIKSSFM